MRHSAPGGRSLLVCLALVCLAGAGNGQTPGPASPSPQLSPEQRTAFESLIKDYLLKNPAVVREALDALKAQEDAAVAEKTKKALAGEHGNIFSDPDSPWLGSANPDVTIVEFFDYRCGFCKQFTAALAKLVETDPKVRVVLKHYPILGPESVYAAKASLAARNNPRFAELYKAMIAASQFTPESMSRTAADAGFDPAFLSGADSPEINALIDRNSKLGAALGVNATPAIVIGEQVTTGAVSYETLTALVAAQRGRQVQSIELRKDAK